MIYFILFTFFFAIFLVVASYSLFQLLLFKNKKRKVYYFISLPFLCISIGLLPSTILHIEKTKEENYFPSVIELPHWKTLEEINFEQWKNLPFYDSEMYLIYNAIEPRNEVAPLIEIKVSKDHSTIENITFKLLLKRFVKSGNYEISGMAIYKTEYTNEGFFLKRAEFIKKEDSLQYCNLYDVLDMAKRINTRDLAITVPGEYDIHVCFQYAHQNMDFRYQFIDVVDSQNEKHRVFISDRTLWIMPVTYLEVSFIKEGYNHKNFMYFAENLEANTEIYLELIEVINEKYFPNQSEGTR